MRSTTGALAVVAALATAGLAAVPGVGAADSCPNAQFRAGAGANLPDCRAFEQVTPLDKNGNGISPRTATLTNATGDRVFFQGPGGVVGTDGAPQDRGFAATRGPAGWTTVASDPPASTAASFLIKTTAGISDDGAKAIVVSQSELAPGATEGGSNLYLRDLEGAREYRLIVSVPGREFYDELTQGPGNVVDATPDGSAVAFQTASQVLDGVPPTGEHRLYVWRDGVITLASRRPRSPSTPATPGQIAAVGSDFITGPARNYRLTDDGRAITWRPTTNDALYRTTGDGITVDITRSRRTTDVQPFSTNLLPISTPDGSQLFFTAGPLTDDSVPGGAIYRYTPADDGLEDLTAAITPLAGDRSFGLIAVSPDGALAWFLSTAALTPGTSPNREHLYVLDTVSGDVSLAAEFDPPRGGLQVDTTGLDYRWSPDGRRVAFRSITPLTGDTASTENPVCLQVATDQRDGLCPQLFSFDADEPEAGPVCVSCGDGQAIGSADFGLNSTTSLSGRAGRGILDDGRVFFTTARRLVPADIDSVTDVYQFTPGVGPQLLTAGDSGSRAVFGDASEDGRDVFFITAQRLVPQDLDGIDDVYTARVGGGLAAQQVAPVTGVDERCTGDACRAAPGPLPARPVQGSATFVEPQLAPAPRFTVRRPSARALRSGARRGRVTIPVRVSQAGSVTVRLHARIGGRSLRPIGRATRRASSAGTVRITVRLSRAARTFLRRQGRLSPRLTVTYSERVRPFTTTLRIITGRTGSNRGGAR